ncbi:hypothetical protein ACIQXW_08290 [Lysinibacillus sp. NPDC097162]|uniref:hypothetical protein n=1 Tax=Lysinibacillus sp. NPDC097162 TaxID=3364140 RepID=UPI00382DD26A
MEISAPVDVAKFIDVEIARPVRSLIVPCVQQAYELVDASLKDISFLNWALGKKHMGYLDNLAVQFTLYEAAKSGALNNIEASIVPNRTKSAYHVELKTKNVIICINRAKNEHVTARKAIYRSLLQLNNQYYWNFGEDEILEEPGYLELTHNHSNRNVSFVNLGVPDGKGKWFNRIDLTKELHLVNQTKKEMNDIVRVQLVKFKEFAQGVQGDGGKN